MASHNLESRWLGRLEYNEALALQSDLVAQRQAGDIPDTLLLLEHEPVYTVGRTPDKSSLRDAENLPHPVIETNRGGQATWHGPGQLVGYPIIDLHAFGQDLHQYLRALEETLIAFCATQNVVARRRKNLTGVWVENRKLASIGVGVRQWVTMHGFAIGIEDNLEAFKAITPCGIDNVQMTTLAKESPTQNLTVQQAAQQIPPHLKQALQNLAAPQDPKL